MLRLRKVCCISGVDSGMNLKVEGEGGESPGRRMRPGNLYVEVEVERDPYFIRKVNDERRSRLQPPLFGWFYYSENWDRNRKFPSVLK